MSKRRLKMLAVFLIANLSVVLISVIYTLLARGSAGGLFSCAFYERTGLYCPGCGGSRSLYYFLRLDFVSSFVAFPALPVTALILLDIDIRALMTVIKDDTRYIKGFRGIVFAAVPAVILINFFVRNFLLIKYGIDYLSFYTM